MTTKQTPKTLLTTDKATLIDIIGMEIEIGGKTFTVDWIDAPKSEDNGKIMVQSDETEIYHIGDRFEAVVDVMSEISSELMRATCVVEDREKLRKRDLNSGVHGKKVFE